MSFKSRFVSVARSIGGATLLDNCRYLVHRLIKYRHNEQFKKKYPHISLPPAYLVYEAFQMDYAKYYLGGQETAKWIAGHLKPYLNASGNRILDWGCGPARVIRHLPNILGESNSYFGCDYNPTSIKWCLTIVPNVDFSLNQINPPLPYEYGTFDAVYGISIFTHLSEDNHLNWGQELKRILKGNGILLITTHGEAFKPKLTASELKTFEDGSLVIRRNAREGHRVYAAFHPTAYLTKLFLHTGLKILKHIPGRSHENFTEQDTWILRKSLA